MRRPLQTTVTAELLFADDAIVVASVREGMERAAHVLDKVTTEWDLTDHELSKDQATRCL